jgi:hypothetical protein
VIDAKVRAELLGTPAVVVVPNEEGITRGEASVASTCSCDSALVVAGATIGGAGRLAVDIDAKATGAVGLDDDGTRGSRTMLPLRLRKNRGEIISECYCLLFNFPSLAVFCRYVDNWKVTKCLTLLHNFGTPR